MVGSYSSKREGDAMGMKQIKIKLQSAQRAAVKMKRTFHALFYFLADRENPCLRFVLIKVLEIEVLLQYFVCDFLHGSRIENLCLLGLHDIIWKNDIDNLLTVPWPFIVVLNDTRVALLPVCHGLPNVQ